MPAGILRSVQSPTQRWHVFLIRSTTSRSSGVDKIQAYRQPLLRRLQKEMPRLGFEPMTPSESTSPIVTFAKKDTQEISRRLKRANVDIAVYPHRVRVSPSVYNDQADVDKLLEALS